MDVTEPAKVLIIDDDRTWQMVLSASLKETYTTNTTIDSMQAAAMAAEWQPDCILLDIEMPHKNGYDVCKEIKENSELVDVPVIFLSSKSSLQEKIHGFEIGAEDYLVKPCETEILKAKVRHAIRQYREKKSLDQKAEAANMAAFEALSGSADLGRSLRFVERTYTMNSFEKLAQGLFQTMEEFGLQTSLMFIARNGPIFFSHNTSEISPLEKEMFIATHQEGRFCDFGNRTFCNFNLASLLIKNMPLENPERYGRIKDTIPWILGATEGKVRALDIQQELIDQEERIGVSLEELRNKLSLLANQTVETHQTLAVPLAESVALVEHIAVEHKALLQKIHEGDQSTQTNELGADEIFSSDVDFF